MFSKNSSNHFGYETVWHCYPPTHHLASPPSTVIELLQKRHQVQQKPSVKCCCCNLRAAFIQIKLFTVHMNAPAGSKSVGHIPSLQDCIVRSMLLLGDRISPRGEGAQVPPHWRSLSRSDGKLCLNQIPWPWEFTFLEKGCQNEETGIMI